MTILSTRKYYEGFTGTDSTIVEPYIVKTDDVTTSSWSVIWDNSAGPDTLPKVGDQHPDSSLFIVQPGGITAARRDNSSYHWDVTVTYTSSGFSISGGSVDRLVSFEVQTRVYTRTANKCYDKTIGSTTFTARTAKTYDVLNSADDPPDPSTAQEEYYHTILVWTQKEESLFNYTNAVGYQGSLNNERITILGVPIDRGKGLLRRVNPVLSTDEDGEFEWRCTYEVEIAETDHWLSLLDQGYSAKISGKKRRIKYKDVPNGQTTGDEAEDFYPDPVLLDGAGGILGGSAEPVFNRFRTKPYENWNTGLNLIQNRIRD